MITKLKVFRMFVADRLWVLQAYLRGKVLGQKGYRPTGSLFHLPVPTTTKRITMLIELWGYRTLTVHELEMVRRQMALAHQPPTRSFAGITTSGSWGATGTPRIAWSSPARR